MLQANLKSSDRVRQARATPSILFSAVPANDDVITYLSSAFQNVPETKKSDASSIRISGNGVAVSAEMLRLTDTQRESLERSAISVTASHHKVVEGADALAVFDSERDVAITLHQMGFVRVRESGTIVTDRFYKVVNGENGSSGMAWARFEAAEGGACVYVHISRMATA